MFVGFQATSGRGELSSYADFTIECCNKYFPAERFKLSKPFEKRVISEEFKRPINVDNDNKYICPVCGSEIIERKRICKTKSGELKAFYRRLLKYAPQCYLNDINEHKVTLIPIYNHEIEKGSKEDYNWFYGYMNRRYDLNDKCREILAIE